MAKPASIATRDSHADDARRGGPPRPAADGGVTALLSAVRGRIRRRATVAAVVSAAGVVTLGTAVAAALDLLICFRERTALVLFGGLVLAGVMLLLGRWLVVLLRGPDDRQIALAVERARPELMDVLAAAVEIEARTARGTPAGPLERLAVERALEQCSNMDLDRIVLPPRLRLPVLALLALLFAGTGALIARTSFVEKAVFRWRELRGSGPAGLVVSPGSVERPYDSDVAVTAEVRRWSPDAWIEYSEAGAEIQRFEMHRTAAPRRKRFTFYAIRSPITYRVRTPALESPWFRILPYHPPAIRRFEMTIEPPAYTGMKQQRENEPSDVTAVVGSTVRFRFRTERCARAVLVWCEDRVECSEGSDGEDGGDSGGEWRGETQVGKNGMWSIELRDSAGHLQKSGPFRITALPDLPPVMEIIDPIHDVATTPARPVRLIGRASDDFGLERINVNYSVSGGPRRQVTLYTGTGTPKQAGGSGQPEIGVEQTVAWSLDPGKVNAREGDVIAVFFTATDNRSPGPQTTRSKVRFIEIRPDLSNLRKKGGLSGQMKELDLSPFIAELKRLIRLTFDVMDGPSSERAAGMERLSRGLRDLGTAVSRVASKIGAGPMGGGRIPVLVRQAVQEIARARALVDGGMLDDALSPEERGLARLTAAQAELLKNATQAQKGQGRKQQSKSKGGKGRKTEETARKQQREEQMKALRKAADELRRLSVAQQDLNDRTARALPSELSALGGKEQQLAERARSVRADLERMPPARPAADTVRAARESMEAAADALSAGKEGGALLHGRRAHGLLERALEQVQDAYKQLAAEEISELSRAARQLADEERRAATQSKDLAGRSPPPAGALDEVAKSQGRLNEATAELLARASRTAGMVQERYAEAAERIARAVQKARDSGLISSQKRAVNALRYRRPERAVRYQTDAANRLLELASGFEEAAGRLPRLSAGEIRKALQRMRELRRQAAEAGRMSGSEALQRLERVHQQAGDEAGRIARGLRDQAFQDIASELSMPLGGNSPGEAAARLTGLLTQAIRVLERYAVVSELKRRARLYRRNAVPPEKYRRLVEEYFRSLSEER